MNNKNLWIASLTGAVVTTLFSNLPVLGLVNCMLCIWFWGGAILAVWLYRRMNGGLTTREGLKVGILTGLCAGMLGLLLSLVGVAGADGFLNAYRQFLPPEDVQDMEEIPAWAGWVFNLMGVLFNILFGALGGYIGGLFLRTDRHIQPGEVMA